MNICVFDTETTSLEKPFCYNIGYIIVNEENLTEPLVKREFVVEQVWHNPMVFASAYYADKRPIYVEAMRAKKIVMDKFGYICQQMIRDFKAYEVEKAFAYNSSFDEKVFAFNCEWFKCNNPFDNVPIADIRGFFHKFLCDDDYKAFCEEHELFTESGNYSTTAENAFRYIVDDTEFDEAHTALADSEIELLILAHCVGRGADLKASPSAYRSIPRTKEKTFKVKADGMVVFQCQCESITYRKASDTVILK